MQHDFLLSIRAKYNQFTKAEKKVADYVFRYPREVLFMSITELAEKCGVGDTSVFRLCRSMDLKGYQEFKMRLSLGIESSGGTSHPPEAEIKPEDTFAQLSQKVLSTNVKALQETISLLDEKTFARAIEKMQSASRICFFGAGTSMLTAMKAANKFLQIEPKILCVQDAHIQAMIAATMVPGETAVLFSYSGTTTDTIHMAKLAKEAGAFVICVTRFEKSPLTGYADITLLSGANEGPFRSGAVSAEISQMFLLDLIYTEYYRRNYEICKDNFEKTSHSVLNSRERG